MTDPTQPSVAERPRNTRLIVAIVILAVALLAVGVLVLVLLLRPSTNEAVPVPSAESTSPSQSVDPSTPVATSPQQTESTVTATTPPASTPATQTPATTAPPKTEPTQTKPKPGPEQQFLGPDKATFNNFTVEIQQYDWAQHEADGFVVYDDTMGFMAEVCVTKAVTPGEKTRISLDPWSVEASNGKVNKALKPTDSHIYKPAFPAESKLGVGECQSGFLNFRVFAEEVDSVTVLYRNGVGDKASWNFH